MTDRSIERGCSRSGSVLVVEGVRYTYRRRGCEPLGRERQRTIVLLQLAIVYRELTQMASSGGKNMSFNDPIVKRYQRLIVLGLWSLAVFSIVVACTSNGPKGLPPPTPDQVRSHADRAFEKLKQEEQERTAQPPVPH
jgi:hypothetical protein